MRGKTLELTLFEKDHQECYILTEGRLSDWVIQWVFQQDIKGEGWLIEMLHIWKRYAKDYLIICLVNHRQHPKPLSTTISKPVKPVIKYVN